MKEESELEHVYKWTGLFIFMYNAVRAHTAIPEAQVISSKVWPYLPSNI